MVTLYVYSKRFLLILTVEAISLLADEKEGMA